MIMKKVSQLLRRITLSCMASTGVVGVAYADTGFYVGGDIGPSYLKPDVDNTSYRNDKNSGFGYGVLGGYNVGPRARIEAQYHKLGAAEVALSSVKTDVDYEVYNFDVNYDLWQNEVSQIFASVGLTALDAESDAPIEKDNSTNIKLGAGYQYFLNENWSTRIAYSQFSGDAGYLSLGLNRHFGRNTPEAEPMVEAVEPMMEAPMQAEPQDQDQDNVMDDQDACPNTLPTLQVDNRGCSIVFDYSFPDVNFEFNSTNLTQGAQRKLDEISLELKKVANKKIEVHAHTDSKGSDMYNIWLSNKRAESIVTYLVKQGIPYAQLIPKGYGETMPVADNKTESGRAQNRRAEFKVIN
jgi:outer membrane protein OmpA-like peptidoglycan-associated protein